MINKSFHILALLLLNISCLCHSENQVTGLNINLQNQTINISPRLNFLTSNEIKEAIDNGIRIRLIAKAQLYKPVSWWFDETLDNKKLNLEISYFITSKLYIVKNIDSNEQLGFNDYDQLWKDFEKLVEFNFNQKITDNTWIKFRIMLDKGALPTAMQLPVLFNDNWDVNTDWYQQQIINHE